MGIANSYSIVTQMMTKQRTQLLSATKEEFTTTVGQLLIKVIKA